MRNMAAETHPGVLRGVHVLDGALATELEARGASIDGPLWSAHVLEDFPDKILAVHRSYLAAGADCIETATYQVSRQGYAECGYTAARADGALRRGVELARRAAAEFPGRRTLVAASLGPYGAALHNGAEYSGDYAIGFAELVQFHRQRIAVLAAGSGDLRPDVLAFETLPSLEEAGAIAAALREWPELPAWFSFTCRDAEHVAHGERLRECAAAVAALPQTAAIGVNCTHPLLIAALIGELRAASGKPVVVYPNSGEGWDAARRCWTGSSDAGEFGALAAGWYRAGAQIVGGCCRTGPQHIREVKRAAAAAGCDPRPA
jgi:homocysteine S-methyltransferase